MDKDYFSLQSDAYKAFRPGYPTALFEALCDGLGHDAVVWDCATGNGQAACELASFAALVVASDMSIAQLQNARPGRNIAYVQALAESMPLPAGSVDLITIAQALHWFDFERYFAEARRVLKPGGRIAAWTYSFLAVAPQLGAEIETVVRWFYHDVVGPYWPPERRWVDEAYRTIPFPFRELPAPACAIEVDWDLPAIVGYLGSWSATQRYRDLTHRDPLRELTERLSAVWGPPASSRHLSWPLLIRLGVRD